MFRFHCFLGLLLIFACTNTAKKEKKDFAVITEEPKAKSTVVKIPVDSVFRIEMDYEYNAIGLTKVSLFQNEVLIYRDSNVRTDWGSLINYDSRTNDFYFLNPQMTDSLIVFVTTFYSEQHAHILRLGTGNVMGHHIAKYGLIINDIREKALIYFTDEKTNFWEHVDSLATLHKYRYDGKHLASVKMKFSEIMDLNNCVKIGDGEKKLLSKILAKFKKKA